MPYLDFVASESADMKPTNVRPSDMSLSKAQPAMVHTYVGSPGLQARLEHKEGEQTTETSAEPEISNVKEKASKATRPSKKKTSSTTTSIREKKQPLPKVPTRKVSKSETPSATSASAEKPSQSPAFPEQPSETINLVVQAGNSSSATTKTALTEEQKRANHIASEQKRRHAIRAAYDALCTVVPSLRAAVQEYEERLSKLHPSSMKTGANAGDEDGMDLDQQPTLQTVAGVLTGGIEVGGEKIDGRAGPRSEAVVLAKSEHSRDFRAIKLSSTSSDCFYQLSNICGIFWINAKSP